MDPAINVQVQPNGSVLVGDQSFDKDQLTAALKEIGGAAGLFKLDGKELKLTDAVVALKAQAGDPGIGSLSLPAPSLEKNGIVDMVMLLQKMKMESDSVQMQSGRENIESIKTKKKAQHEEKIEKLEQRIKDIEESAGKAKKAGTWGKVGQAVSILTGVMAIAAGAALTLFSAGTGAPLGVMLAMVGATLIATTVTEMTTGKDPYIEMFKSLGMVDEAAMVCGMMTKLAVTLVAGLGTALYTGGVTLAAGAVGIAAAVALTVVSAVMTLIPGLLSATAGIGKSVISLQSAAAQRDADDAQTEVKELEKWMKLLQAKMADETEMIGELIEQINEGFDKVMGIMSSVSSSTENIASAIRRTA